MQEPSPESPTNYYTAIKQLITHEKIRLVRFCAVGVTGVLVNLSTFELCFSVLLFSFVPSNAMGIVVSVFSNFMLNDNWTWGDRTKKSFTRRLIKFYVVSLIAATVQLFFSYACYEWLGLQRHLSLLIGMGLATGINFMVNNLWTFGKKGPPSEEKA